MTSCRPSIFLPPPPPLEPCPPMPPRRTATFGTQTIDRDRVAPNHPSLTELSDLQLVAGRLDDTGNPGQAQFLVQTPFGCVFAPSSTVSAGIQAFAVIIFVCHVDSRCDLNRWFMKCRCFFLSLVLPVVGFLLRIIRYLVILSLIVVWFYRDLALYRKTNSAGKPGIFKLMEFSLDHSSASFYSCNRRTSKCET